MKLKQPIIPCLLAAWLGTHSSQGEITYVDAVEGPGGNTFATGGSNTDTSWLNDLDAPTADEDQWTKRTGVAFNGGDAFQAIHSLPDEMPELTTQITGLPNGTYDIWVFYWDKITSNTENWVISAGLNSGSLLTFSGPDKPIITGTTKSNSAKASTLQFTGPMSVGIDGETLALFGVKVGKAKVSQANPTIEVYIDDLIGGAANRRTWYDGVGYEPTSEITYVDAVTGVDGNTFATGSTQDDITWLIDPGAATSVNNQWQARAFGTNATLLQALPSGDPSEIPELTTSITGLSDGTYDVWAFFQDNVGDTSIPIQDWIISAGLTSGSLETYHALGEGPVTGAVSEGVWEARSLALDDSVVVVEGTGTGERRLYGVNLGTSTVTNGSSIDVFIDMYLEGSGSSRRVWYDGVGYASTSPSNNRPLAITSFSPQGAGIWEVTLEGGSNTSYVFSQSSALDFAPGTIISGLSQNDVEDDGTIGGGLSEIITTNDQGLATVRLPLGPSPTTFIRAQLAP